MAANIDSAFPLSPLQQGILFHALEAPGSGMYVVQTRSVCDGPLHVAALYRAWQHVIRRHQALRAAFVWEGVDEPMQVIGRDVRAPIAYADWRGMPAPLQQRRLDAWAARDRAIGFSLSRAPLMRLLLVRTSEDRHELIWTCHHIIVDGWARAIVMAEVSRCYDAFAAGRPPMLPRALPYSAHIARLPRDLGPSERFWRAQLRDFAAPTPLWKHGSPAVRIAGDEARGADITLTRQRSRAIHNWCRRHAVSLATLIMGAWALVLSRYSGESDVVFGITVSGRSAPLEGIERLVGLCMNTLPARVRLPRSARAVAFLRGLQRQCAEMREHEHTPLSKVQQWSGVARGGPLFDSLVVFENFPVDAARPRADNDRGVAIGNVRGVNRTNYPILLVSSPAPELPLHLEWDPAHLPSDAAERLLGHLATVLTQLTAEHETTLDAVSLLEDSEHEQIVRRWNGASDPTRGATLLLVDTVTAQAMARPHAIAIVSDDEHVSYGMLHGRARQLALVLLTCGVGPEVPVAVCLHPGVALVEVMLAVWLSGGAYVPLDPRLPRERLTYLVADVGARVVVTDAALAEASAGLWAGLRVVCVDRHVDRREAVEALSPRRTTISSETLAYVIYTSGSTGRPKGVAVTHGNVTELFAAGNTRFAFTTDDTWTWFHSASFDFSVWEIWGALQAGARLIAVSHAAARAPERFHELLRREQVTVLNQTPSAFASLQHVAASSPSSPLALRLVIFGGEALDAGSLRDWVRRYGASQPSLVNMYGITETTVHVTHHAVTAADVQAPSGSRIGRALPAWQAYVLDGAGQPSPVDISGELFVGGAGIARGYVGRPDLTAQRFVPDPFSGTPGARLYRAGDRARWRGDGVMEYGGRVDHQIKVRGYRIEPGEIEAVLRQQADVRDALVQLREDEAGDRRLVAYVIGSTFAQMDHWYRQLRAFLPEYMIPSAIVPLDTWPLTANGKIDRMRLPAPGAAREGSADRGVAPRTPAEVALAAIWADVLRVERVSIHDNFFELGGDSMRVIQVQGKARQRGLAIAIEHLMRHQTIARLARHIEAAEAAPATITRPFDLVSAADRRLLPATCEDAYPLTELQRGMLFHSELEPDSPVYHDIESFRLRMPCDVPALRAALVDVMSAHAILRTSVHMTGFSEPLQLVHVRCEPPLYVQEWPAAVGEAGEEGEEGFASWLRLERRRRFDWSTPALFRVFVHRRPDGTLQWTLICHHAILDGWSVATFLSELAASYFARLASVQAEPTPPPQTTFREYVAREVEAANSTAARDYWLDHLGDRAPTAIPRWADRPTRAELRRIESHTMMLPDDVAAGLRRVAATASVPLKSVLLAGHLRVLAWLANEDEVLSGLVTHGRTGDAGADRVLGLFLSTMPVRCDATRGTWLDLLRRVFDIECAHATHRYFSMGLLRRASGRRDLYDAAFNFVNFHVYQTLARVTRLDVLGGRSVAETEIPLLVQGTTDDVTGRIELRADADMTQFTSDQIARLLACHERAYAACASDPYRACADVVLLSDAERHQVVVEWNAMPAHSAAKDFNLGDRRELWTIPRRVIEQAQRAPAAIAVVDDNRTLTYAELARLASQVAGVLRRRGVGPETAVGLCAPRSVDAVFAILGAMQAGGAYVPLDPAHPDERLRMMVEDSAVHLVLTTRALAPRLAAIVPATLCVEDCALVEGLPRIGDGKPAGVVDPEHAVDPEQVACVIHTSGSTGRPKGIALRHRGLTDLIDWYLARVGSGARTLQFASLGFDVSLLEIAATLCGGGALYLVPEPIRADRDALGRYLEAHAIEHATLPVVVFQQLAEAYAARPEPLRGLRQIITTGEQLRLTPAIASLLAALPDCAFHNHYGPAETHVWVTAHTLRGDPRTWPALPPIGQPLDNTRAYVLDRRGEPVPPGTPGELLIGGLSLARGYHHRPDLTADRFVPDHVSGEPGSRCYRTGDLARWSPAGELEFLGRRDHQVKIRGHRIELGEVEAALARHPGIASARVVAREYAPGDTRLVAYFAPVAGAAVAAVTLRDELARVLPEPMIPGAFVAVAAFPLTRNGKLDLQRLPAPDVNGAADAVSPAVLPRTPAERFVAAVFCQLLRVDAIGIHDRFFERGGHSLLATQAIVRLREAFGVDVPLRTLFERPTVSGMVTALGELFDDRAMLDDIAATVLEVGMLSDADVHARLSALTS